MDQRELVGAVTYARFFLSGTKRAGRGLSRTRDRRSIVVVRQR